MVPPNYVSVFLDGFESKGSPFVKIGEHTQPFKGGKSTRNGHVYVHDHGELGT